MLFVRMSLGVEGAFGFELLPTPQEVHEKDADDEHQSRDDVMLVVLDTLADVRDAAEMFAREIAEVNEESPTDDRGQPVGNDEFYEVKSDRAGGDDHRAAHAGEHAADRDDPDAV